MTVSYDDAKARLLQEIKISGDPRSSEYEHIADAAAIEEFLNTYDFSDPLSDRILIIESDELRDHLEYIVNNDIDSDDRAALTEGDYSEDDGILDALHAQETLTSRGNWKWMENTTIECFVAVDDNPEDGKPVGEDLSGIREDVRYLVEGAEVIYPEYPHSVYLQVEMTVEDLALVTVNKKVTQEATSITVSNPCVVLWDGINGSGDAVDYQGKVTVNNPVIYLESNFPGYVSEAGGFTTEYSIS